MMQLICRKISSKSNRWSVTNNMQFNDVKFDLLRYGTNKDLKDTTSYVSPSFKLIEEKESVKDLGVTLSSDGTFKVHINNLIESAKNMSSWILRTFRTRDQTTMLTLYKSLVRPILEYSSVLWTPITKGDIQRLEEIQQSFLRKIRGVSRNYGEALKQLNLYSLERRRERYIAIQVWKMIEGLAPNLKPALLQQTTIQQRRGRTLKTPNLNATPSYLQKIKRQSVRCFGVKIFNSLPKHIRNITETTVEQFKQKLDQFLRKTSDLPHLRSGANNGRNNSNHLYDISPLLNNENNTVVSPNSNPQVQCNDLSRRLSVEELTTLVL